MKELTLTFFYADGQKSSFRLEAERVRRTFKEVRTAILKNKKFFEIKEDDYYYSSIIILSGVIEVEISK